MNLGWQGPKLSPQGILRGILQKRGWGEAAGNLCGWNSMGSKQPAALPRDFKQALERGKLKLSACRGSKEKLQKFHSIFLSWDRTFLNHRVFRDWELWENATHTFLILPRAGSLLYHTEQRLALKLDAKHRSPAQTTYACFSNPKFTSEVRIPDGIYLTVGRLREPADISDTQRLSSRVLSLTRCYREYS